MGFISAIIKFFKKEQETKPLEQKDSAMNESPNIQNTNTDKKLKQEQKASVSNEKPTSEDVALLRNIKSEPTTSVSDENHQKQDADTDAHTIPAAKTAASGTASAPKDTEAPKSPRDVLKELLQRDV
ncbi:hypothetical protein [Treponema phagedenis]|uniref:Uncharacterized protein n=1 Tax=Treponema phagedenis TaxID=162 RepID=A0AAE6IW89_TREPH|nr:hypothetical protein [Treponema phagedenis]QEJ99351.1 hypothetical protein FUT82_16055 [Treponema phagedenis]QEK00003.1 hypothetical protein FUT84_01610 [Treponema phagedenis]QEK04921.1 hypothetical protein FUT83_14700 [Treponema phagedenis]QEK10543.1 hypothetical protein FUT81_14620 [Treponema phagedenis]TYT78920.1 hypothetical protein FS559_07245 [Treponema phagedenis]